jgi:hypothetical protein
VSSRNVTLMVGSGDVKFARAAGTSTKETAKAGLDYQHGPH